MDKDAVQVCLMGARMQQQYEVHKESLLRCRRDWRQLSVESAADCFWLKLGGINTRAGLH